MGGRFARWEWAALGGILLVYLVVALLAIRRGPPLGWDESVYSLRAGDFADGAAPRHYWDSYRAPGLPWVLHLLWGWGSHPTVFRLAVAGFGLGLVVVTWLLARHLFGPRPAAGGRRRGGAHPAAGARRHPGVARRARARRWASWPSPCSCGPPAASGPPGG